MQLLQILWERREFFATCLLEHIRISLTAVLCAGVLGIAIGIWISRHKKAAGIVLGIINVIYTIPSISLLGFLIPFTGIGNKTAIIALTVYGLLPIVRNTYTAAFGNQVAFSPACHYQRLSEYGGDDHCHGRDCIVYRGRRFGLCYLQRDYYL